MPLLEAYAAMLPRLRATRQLERVAAARTTRMKRSDLRDYLRQLNAAARGRQAAVRASERDLEALPIKVERAG